MTAPGPEPLHGYRLRNADDAIARLDNARRSRRVSLRDLADDVGCAPATLSTNLRGLHRMDAATLFAAYDALGIDLALIPRDTEVAHCARVGLHNCGGEWRNHDRTNDLPEPS